MKGACFFVKNPTPKPDLVKVLTAIVAKFKLPKKFEKSYIDFLVNFSGELDTSLDNKNIQFLIEENEITQHFRTHKRGTFAGWAFNGPNGEISQIHLTTSIGEYHIPVYAFSNFETVLFQLINIGGLDLWDTDAFEIAETDGAQRGLHMSILEEDFGSMYFVQDLLNEPLPFGRHKVANSFSELINSLKFCIVTYTESHPHTIREIGHCIDDQE